MKQRLLKLSIQTTTINKTLPPAKGWVNSELTIQQLNEHVRRGHPFTCQLLNGYREAKNFQAMDVAAVDIDGGLTWERALKHPIITKHAALLYTTPSHLVDAPRLRVVFVLPDTVSDAVQMRCIYQSLSRALGGDGKATDPARQFYGSTGCKSKILSGVLSASDLAAIVKDTAGQLSSKPAIYSEKLKKPNSRYLSANTLMVTTAPGRSAFLSDLPEKTSVHCPFHDDKKPSAFVVRSKQGSQGIHCHACGKTFWDSDHSSGFDFYKFDRQVHKLANNMELEKGSALQRLARAYNSTPKATIVNSRYLDSLPAGDGLVLVKSPKGTGKTELLSQLVQQEKRRNKNVLVLSHRRLLISQMCNRLGLESYLDCKPGQKSSPKHFVVCLDSLSKHLSKSKTRYHTVIIDECEQVLSHICNGTILLNQQDVLLMRILDLINTADRVLLLDADMSDITLDTLAGGTQRNKKIKILLNVIASGDGSIDMYASRSHLLIDLRQAIQEGKRCFITSNSKERINKIHHDLTNSFPGKKFYKLTADDVGREDVSAFISNINESILSVDALLCTPVLGTGADISFDGAKKIDVVFGFFEANINTHFDIDQQISRVRDPGSVKVYISRKRFRDSCEYDDVVQKLIDAEDIPGVIVEISKGQVLANHDHPILRLQAYVKCQRNASCNNLYGNFINHRERSGWSVNLIEADHAKRRAGNLYERKITTDYKNSEANRILSAKRINELEYEELQRGKRLNKLIEDDRYTLIRAEIERFYKRRVRRDLIDLDDGGRFRKRSKLFNLVTDCEIQNFAREMRADNVVEFPLNQMRLRNIPAVLLQDIFLSAGVLTEDGFDSNVDVRSNQLKSFVELCAGQKDRIRSLLELRLRSDFAQKPARQLGDFLKLVGLSLVMSKTRRLPGGRKEYIYRIDCGQLRILQKYSSNISLKRKRAPLAA